MKGKLNLFILCNWSVSLSIDVWLVHLYNIFELVVFLIDNYCCSNDKGDSKPVARYYGRRKEDKSSSELSVDSGSSDSDDEKHKWVSSLFVFFFSYSFCFFYVDQKVGLTVHEFQTKTSLDYQNFNIFEGLKRLKL